MKAKPYKPYANTKPKAPIIITVIAFIFAFSLPFLRVFAIPLFLIAIINWLEYFDQKKKK